MDPDLNEQVTVTELLCMYVGDRVGVLVGASVGDLVGLGVGEPAL